MSVNKLHWVNKRAWARGRDEGGGVNRGSWLICTVR